MKSKKNVLIITVAGIIGGMEKLFLTAMPLLAQKGYDFIFCVNEKGPAIDAYRKLGFGSVIIADNDPKACQKMGHIMRTYDIDLVHNNEFSLPAALAANHLGIKHLVHLHGKIENILEGSVPLKLMKKHISAVCSISDFAVGCSQFVTNQLNGIIDPLKLRCIYGGVAIGRYIVPKLKYGQRKTVGMIAHFYPLKRHSDFIRAAKQVLDSGLDINFFIAGHVWINDEPQERYCNTLKKLISDLGLDHRVKLYKGLEDITHLYKEMDIFVLPSLGDGLSIALLEAMQHEIPVIVTKSGGFPEVVSHEHNGFLVEARKPKEIAQTIIRLLKDENLAKRVGQNARKTVEERFNINRFVGELADVYALLL